MCLKKYYYVSEKPGAAPPPAEAPAAAPTKKLENLFFIEEPKAAHVTESKTQTWSESCTVFIVPVLTV